MLIGPLPATALLLPFLLAGALGSIFALAANLADPATDRVVAVRMTAVILGWVAAATIGVTTLWAVTLADSPVALRATSAR